MARSITRKFLSLFVLISLGVIGVLFISSTNTPDKGNDRSEITLTAENSSVTDVVKDGKSDYIIVFSGSDGVGYDNDFASEIQNDIKNKLGVNLYPRLDTTAITSHEILIGKTNRAFSEELEKKLNVASVADNLVWIIAEKDGKIAYLANSEEAFKRGKADFLAFITEEGFSVPSGISDISILSRAEYEEELRLEQERLEAEKEQQRLQRIEELKALIADFDYADFGDAPETSMNGIGYGDPALFPKAGEHPRVNVSSYMIPDILKYMETDEAKYTVEEFWNMANAEYTGILPPAAKVTTGIRQGVHNMDEAGLGKIEAKAFAYLLTGNELYAYEAVYAMKNFLTTIDIQYIHSDQCREFGRIIYCTAEVYDWCYDILTDSDKAQFIMACADIGSSQNENTQFGNQMEVGFPPKLQGCVSGHGSEHQVLRDYLSIAIAVFDEDPSWYNWVGGLIYNKFIPVRDYYFKSGTYPQGVNIYAAHRFDADLWSAWLMFCATGEIPYSADFSDITRSFFQNEAPDGTLFGTGDGSRLIGDGNNPCGALAYWHHAVISSALFGDKDLRSQAFKYSSAFTAYPAYTVSFSFAHALILSASYYEKTGYDTEPVNRFSGSEPVCYFGSPLGQMTVRSEWNNSAAAAVFMKLGERTTANHEHGDAGTFQIFYKGLYTGDTGIYEGYGTDHHYYYHQATVAHNGLLISNPAKIGDDPKNPSSYYYSGSQKLLGEAVDLDAWLDTKYNTGTVTGADWAYKSDGTTDYAYLGGSITEAYDSDTVSYVGRHMLALYTGNPDAPMYLMVYDKITSVEAGFKKSFLLHTATEPIIDSTAKTVTYIENDGKLVLKSLLGADSITAVGGKDMEFSINGRQCKTLYDSHNGQWGRVEISPNTDALTHYLVNFMYVTDKDSEPIISPTLVTSENMHGIVVDDNVIVFAECEDESNTEELSFTVEGTGLRRFIVTGMFPGTWNISVDGVNVAHSVATDKGGVITFYAPAGNVVISPGKNIVPSNGGRLIYHAFGGIVPDDAPLVYEIGVPVMLPSNIENGVDKFVGWYTSPTFEEETRVEEFIGTEKGKVNLYAKYSGIAFSEDYEKLSFEENRALKNGIGYNGKSGAVYKTVTDEKTGNTYLHITRGTQDPQIDVTKAPGEFLYEKTTLTLVIDLARDESAPITGTCRLRGKNGSSDTIPFFTILTDGSVMLGDKVHVMTLTEEFQTLAVSFDFAAGTLTSYDSDANPVASISITPPAASGVSTNLEWLETLTATVNWWMGSGEALLIDNFSAYSGEYVPRPVSLPEGYAKLTYKLNGGAFISEPEKMYKEGVLSLLQPNVVKAGDEFLGWYTTPDFKPGTRIVEISPDMAGELTVYARWAGRIADADFEGESGSTTDSNITLDGITFSAAGQAGSLFSTKEDPDGNTYIYWNKGPNKPQIKYTGSLGDVSAINLLTYKISLKSTVGESPLVFDFRIRATSKPLSATNSKTYLNIFSTDADGNVLLGGNTKIATLTSDKFTDIIISVDFENKQLIAYNTDTTEIARENIDIENHTDWLAAVDLPMFLFPKSGDSVNIDNISISRAPYALDEEAPESTLAKIDYILSGGGELPEDAPVFYKKGEAVTLPIPTREGASFLGWFKDARFTEPISEITAIDTENFVLYAKWALTVLDYDASKNDFNFDGGNSSGVLMKDYGGFTFQTKGQNSYYQTLTNEKGERYLLWSKGSGDPQLIHTGNLADKAGNNLIISYSLTFAKDGDNDFLLFQARMRTPNIDGARKELMLFNLANDGTLYLSNSQSERLVVGQFGVDFKTLTVVADFSEGMLYGYNELGEKTCEVAMSLHSSFTSPEEMYSAVVGGDILGFYAGDPKQTTIRIKQIKIDTGNIFEI